MSSATTDLARLTWRAKTPLLPHQQDAVAKLLPTRVGALFMDMGTGKTRTAIELVRLRQHKIDRVIWFCPVSLKETISYELEKHTDCPKSAIYVFDDRTNERALPRDALWYIVGIESMSASARVVLTVNQLITERSFVIVDESTYIKGYASLRTERITAVSARARYRLVLTGTPLTQGVVDLYAQMRFLSPKILGYRSFYSFARNHLEYSDRYPGKIVRAHNVDYLAAKIRPYVYQVTKDEAGLWLPDKLYETYATRLSPKQREAYERVKQELLWEVPPEDWDSLYIFRLFTALQGIVCGFWRRPNGDLVELPHNRVDLLLSVLQQIPAPEKVIIWAKYHYSIRQIVEALVQVYGREAVAEFHGDLPEGRRNQELARWRESAQFLVATQGVGGHGLDLTAARYMVFYANTFKYSERLQAEDRVHRIGQERRPVYIDLTAGSGIERRISEALAKKGDALAAFRREVDKIKRQGTKERIRELIKSL